MPKHPADTLLDYGMLTHMFRLPVSFPSQPWIYQSSSHWAGPLDTIIMHNSTKGRQLSTTTGYTRWAQRLGPHNSQLLSNCWAQLLGNCRAKMLDMAAGHQLLGVTAGHYRCAEALDSPAVHDSNAQLP